MKNNNAIWRLDADNLAAYTEDRAIMAKIRRYYPEFFKMAEYYRDGRLHALQYRIPGDKKRSARRIFGVNMDGTQYAKTAVNEAL